MGRHDESIRSLESYLKKKTSYLESCKREIVEYQELIDSRKRVIEILLRERDDLIKSIEILKADQEKKWL
jgi:vacuolar-type H+-ATPase subunit I/STV1